MAGSYRVMDETYDLRGLDMSTPDQILTASRRRVHGMLVGSESPYTINSRMFAREDGASRVANRTRHGSSRIGEAVGQTLRAQNVSAVGPGEYAFGDLADGSRRIVAMKFTATATGPLTRLDLELRKALGSFGHVPIQICANNVGYPGQVLGASSILGNTLTDTLAYCPSYFMDAPTLISSTDYWIVWYMQDNGVGSYFGNLNAGALGLASADGGTSWGPAGGNFRFKTYQATDAPAKGYTRRYPSDSANRTLLAYGGTVASFTDLGVATVLDATLDANADYVRFAHIDDKTIWVNNSNNPRWTTDGGAGTVADVPSAPAGAFNVIVHQNRVMWMLSKTLVRFSNLYPDITTIDSTNFFYVPSPKSSDPMTAWCQFQNNLLIFTHETKHVIRGSDISTFQRDEMKGSKGAVSQEAIAVAPEGVYFMSDDKQIYLWNGVKDIPISEPKVQPELQGITDTAGVRLHYYNNQLRVYYHKSPDTTNNRMLLFDTIFQQWFMDTGRCVAGSLEWTQDNNELIELNANVAWLFTGEQGYSDAGKAINYKYWTPYKKYGSAASKKRVRSFRPVVRVAGANYTLSVGKDIDFLNSPDMRAYVVAGGGAAWGAFVWGDGTKWGGSKLVQKKAGMSGRGNHIQYRFERNGVETPVELYGYVSQLKEGRPK